MHIDWATLAVVAMVAAAVAVTVVLLVAFALVGLSADARRQTGDAASAAGGRPGVGTAVAVLCVLAAGVIVCYGLYLIIT